MPEPWSPGSPPSWRQCCPEEGSGRTPHSLLLPPRPHQALQYGAGEREGNVDGGPQERQGQEEVQARQQGPLHLQDVPARGLCHRGPEEPPHRWQVGASSLLSELAPWFCEDLPSVLEIKSCVFSSGLCLFPEPRESGTDPREGWQVWGQAWAQASLNRGRGPVSAPSRP